MNYLILIKLLKKRNLIFSGNFETDEIGYSLHFYNLNYIIKGKKEKKELKYLDDITKKELNEIKDKK